MKRTVEIAERLARHDRTILIAGETGVGKTSIARHIHQGSRRSAAPLVQRGCGEFDLGTLEATLFGHSRDAYTSAATDQIGILASADGATLLLDDIDYLSASAQARLLRFLDDGVYFRLGEPTRAKKASTRIIVTTNKNLAQLSDAGLFLKDLYFRLRQWQIQVPPLRERPEDVDAFANHFLHAFQRQSETHGPEWSFSAEALNFLRMLHWPGNLRQLRQTVETIAVFAASLTPVGMDEATRILLDPDLSPDAPCLQLLPGVGDDERYYRVLQLAAGNISMASRLLGCSRTTLHTRIKARGWSFQA